MTSSKNGYGQGASHAAGDSMVPDKAQQEVLPKGVEDAAPNKVHDTGSSGSKSDAIRHRYVSEAIQEAVPESVERAIPNVIHDSGNKYA